MGFDRDRYEPGDLAPSQGCLVGLVVGLILWGAISLVIIWVAL